MSHCRGRGGNLDCIIWGGCVKQGNRTYCKPYGVINVKLPGKSRHQTVTVHRLMYMIEHRTFELNPHFDVSHLCHNSLCINASHLSLQPHYINNNRQHRTHTVPKHFTGHPGYQDCLFFTDDG
jgi:hypothetical protein